MKNMRLPLLLLLCAVTIAACGTTTLLNSGQAIDALGKQFIETGRQFDALHTSGIVSDADYRLWAAFVPKFKTGYAEASKTWLTAYQAGEPTTPQQIIALITTLKNQLLEFAIRLQAAKGKAP